MRKPPVTISHLLPIALGRESMNGLFEFPAKYRSTPLSFFWAERTPNRPPPTPKGVFPRTRTSYHNLRSRARHLIGGIGVQGRGEEEGENEGREQPIPRQEVRREESESESDHSTPESGFHSGVFRTGPIPVNTSRCSYRELTTNNAHRALARYRMKQWSESNTGKRGRCGPDSRVPHRRQIGRAHV